MIKVKMFTTAAGPGGQYLAGGVYLVDPDLADDLMAGGFAELVEDPAPEAAIAPPPEAAVTPPPKPKRAAVKRKTKK